MIPIISLPVSCFRERTVRPRGATLVVLTVVISLALTALLLVPMAALCAGEQAIQNLKSGTKRPAITLGGEVGAAANAQHDEIGIAKTTQERNTDRKAAAWFSERGLGLFVHFGLPSVAEGYYDLSWSMVKGTGYDKQFEGRNKLAPNQYYALAKRFNPAHFNPDKWLAAAREAGFGYAVLTTRHHDGFALWPSDYGDLSTKNFMESRDLVREYVEACRRNGLKVGFYYSPPDWYRERYFRSWGSHTKGTPESPHLGLNHEPVTSLQPKPVDFEKTTADYLNGQIRELLTNYGTIDYLWFDGSAKGVMSQEEIRKLQPGIMINDRQHGGGDVITEGYECRLPKERPKHLWEHCYCMTGHGSFWGYTKPLDCLPANAIAAKLARVRAWGGNELANFGPQPDGDMPPEFYRCMAEVKAWRQWAAPAFDGAGPGPYPEQCNLPVTVKGDTWFVHLVPATLDGPAAGNTISIKEKRKLLRATWLRTGQAMDAVSTKDGTTIQAPDKLRTDWVDIVKLEWTPMPVVANAIASANMGDASQLKPSFKKEIAGAAARDFSAVTHSIQEWVEKGYYSGASLTLVKDSDVIYQERFGNHTAESVEYIASAGKWLAGATILAVVDSGKLNLDDPVSKWLPEFTGEAGKARVRHLLSHTSGYPPYREMHEENLAAALVKSIPFTMDAPPGTRWNYGGFPMDVAGRIAELATGQAWENIFQTRIAKPLGMRDTHFAPMDLTHGHNPLLGGGARSSVRDYVRFLTMVSQGGVFEGRRILSENAIREMLADQVRSAAVPPDNFANHELGAKHTGIYGLGLWREEVDAQSEARLVSSPSWAGAYPWLDMKEHVFGFFLAHVVTAPGNPATRDGFAPMAASAKLPRLVRSAIQPSNP